VELKHGLHVSEANCCSRHCFRDWFVRFNGAAKTDRKITSDSFPLFCWR